MQNLSEEDFKQKYLKYKAKYLKLKGGAGGFVASRMGSRSSSGSRSRSSSGSRSYTSSHTSSKSFDKFKDSDKVFKNLSQSTGVDKNKDKDLENITNGNNVIIHQDLLDDTEFMLKIIKINPDYFDEYYNVKKNENKLNNDFILNVMKENPNIFNKYKYSYNIIKIVENDEKFKNDIPSDETINMVYDNEILIENYFADLDNINCDSMINITNCQKLRTYVDNSAKHIENLKKIPNWEITRNYKRIIFYYDALKRILSECKCMTGM